jgi:hypothetical protein
MGATHFYSKTLRKVAAEIAHSVLAYNLSRVRNIVVSRRYGCDHGLRLNRSRFRADIRSDAAPGHAADAISVLDADNQEHRARDHPGSPYGSAARFGTNPQNNWDEFVNAAAFDRPCFCGIETDRSKQ